MEVEVKEFTLIELLNMLIKESSLYITNIKDLLDELKLVKIINAM